MAAKTGCAVRLGVATLLVAGIATAGALVHRARAQQRILEETSTGATGIDALETVEIGGVPQKLLIRGESLAAPVLVFFHGGPGRPFLPEARRHLRMLEDRFVVVTWAQRGTVGSNPPGLPPVTLEQLLDDAATVVDWAAWRLDKKQVFLMGESWGSLLGALTAARKPAALVAYIGVSQMVHPDAARLLDDGRPPAGSSGGSSRLASLREQLLPVWLSPHYGLREIARGLLDPHAGARVVEEAAEVDLREAAPQIDVPVYLFEGSQDSVTPSDLARSYFEVLDAPEGKDFVAFYDAGHDLIAEQPELFSQRVDSVLEHIKSSRRRRATRTRR